MITHILSRYRPRYIRSLIYMLQACEYNVSDYLSWYGRTYDFRVVERRKTLVKTAKVRILYFFAYAIIIASLAYIYEASSFAGINARVLILACTFLLMPYVLPVAILIPLLFLKVFQIFIQDILMSAAKRKLFEHKGLRIAIAGSFGKTSMREILRTVLNQGKKVASPPQSYNTPLGICRFISELKGDEDVIVFELGEYHPGDIIKLCKLIDPHIGAITGINEAHLEKFGTLDKTAATIFELADYLDKKPVYINAENELARKNADSSLRNHILYSREGAGNCRVKNQKTDLSGTSFSPLLGDLKFTVKSKLLGLHTIGPLAVSADIAYHLGFDRKQIELGIEKTKAFPHRLEPREDSGGVVTLDDSYNGNPDGVRAVIDFLASLKGHRRWYVTPGLVEMGARTIEVHKEIGGRLAKAGIEKVVLIRDSVTPYIEQGLKESNYAGEILWFDDGPAAYAALPHLTAKGDVVLLQNDWPDQYA